MSIQNNSIDVESLTLEQAQSLLNAISRKRAKTVASKDFWLSLVRKTTNKRPRRRLLCIGETVAINLKRKKELNNGKR